MENMRKNDPLYNIDIFVQIVCDEQEFKCHMFVLAARSPVFQVTFYLLAATPHEASRGYFGFKEKFKKYLFFLEAIYRILVNLSSLKKENRMRPVLRKFSCYT